MNEKILVLALLCLAVNLTGQSYGLSLYSENDKLFFMTDALYSSSMKTFAVQSNGPRRTPLDPAVNYTSSSKDLRMVVNAGYKYKGLKLGIGPEFSYNLATEENFSEVSGISAVDNKLQAGFNFLVGYKLTDNIHMDMRHTYIFQDVSNSYMYDNIPMNLNANPKFVELSLGFYL